jgi:hypothetical protein
LAISKGIDRDRAVDESGNQLSVFGRRGARPLNQAEAQRLYLRDGTLYTVADDPQASVVNSGNLIGRDLWRRLAATAADWLRAPQTR